MPPVTKGLKNIYKALMQLKKNRIMLESVIVAIEDIKECASIAAKMFDHIIRQST
jgi:hypothetical protein